MYFTKHPKNPIYGGKATGTIFDVFVTRKDQGYRMDFSWRPQKALAVAFSEDGLQWTFPEKVMEHDPESGWEDDINRNGFIIRNGRYEMWYTGQAGGKSYIGMAVSEDGLKFKKASPKPVLVPELDWEYMSVMNPCVLFDGGRYKMWYAAGETYEPNVLAYAESSDGLNWKKREKPIFTCEKKNAWEQDRVGGCQVLKDERFGYIMFYIGYRDINTAAIGVAISENGIDGWKRCRANPLVEPDGTGFDGEACYKPSALYDEKTGLWRVWYNGRKGSDEFVGLAEGRLNPEDF